MYFFFRQSLTFALIENMNNRFLILWKIFLVLLFRLFFGIFFSWVFLLSADCNWFVIDICRFVNGFSGLRILSDGFLMSIEMENGKFAWKSVDDLLVRKTLRKILKIFEKKSSKKLKKNYKFRKMWKVSKKLDKFWKTLEKR